MLRLLLALGVASLLAACGPAAGTPGSGCTSDADCKGKLCLTDKPGGYCSADCTGSPCPSGSVCVARSAGKGGANAGAGGSCGASSVCLATCAGASDCATGYVCAAAAGAHVCLPACSTDADCGASGHCSAGQCQGTAAAGAACQSDSDCGGGLTCNTTFIDGACTQPCVPGCAGVDGGQCSETGGANAAPCPGNTRCAQVGETQGLCLVGCSADADCRAGYVCDPRSKACRSKCASNLACGAGSFCDVCTGACREGKARPGETGAACAGDAECTSHYCLTEDLDWPGGSCSKSPCASNADCPDNGVCLTAIDPPICLERCGSNFECRRAYYCADVGGGDSVCLPRCTQNPQAFCGDELPICDPLSGACVPDGGVGTSVVDRVDLGTVDIHANQNSAEVSFTVPADAVSFTLVLEGGLGGQSTIGTLTAPDGHLVFDLDHFSSSEVRIIPVNDGDFGVIYPNSPRISLQPGAWRASFYNENGGGQGRALVFYKRTPGGVPPTQGRLPLNLFFCGVQTSGRELHAADGPTDPDIQAMLGEVQALYGQPNSLGQPSLLVGPVTYFDCDQNFAEIRTTEGKDSDLRHLFEQSRIVTQADPSNHAMNFYLVHEIASSQPGFITLGIAGGIPGIPYEEGTNASGVAVTTADLGTPDGDKAVARVMAHEGGHWLGLFHTTEQPGTSHDPLPDTQECDASHDRNGDSIVVADECQGTGSQYMMFWEANDGARSITDNQFFVLLRNPVVR